VALNIAPRCPMTGVWGGERPVAWGNLRLQRRPAVLDSKSGGSLGLAGVDSHFVFLEEVSMRYYIYGLIDPRDYKVRYVGKTSQRIDRRLEHHLGQARRGKNTRPVYQWLRALAPLRPWVVCLEIVDCPTVPASTEHGTNLAESTETKWIMRLRREVYQRLPEHSRVWKHLAKTPPLKFPLSE
jgi:hypothetical protein